jgi:hypothetical protein
MSNRYFLIGIGGTGMRCIEAVTHLAAMGMFDGKELDILSIDTDLQNGNKSRTEQLVSRYERIKGGPDAEPTSNTFFSAKLRLFEFAPVYSGDASTYAQLARLSMGDDDQRRMNKDLSDLLFDEGVQNFQLDHGYRAQTHLGSLLMYHTILDAAKRVRNGNDARKQDKALIEFVTRLQAAGTEARVFIFGSIFGGTGASSIPVIPRALRAAWKEQGSGNDLDAKYGSVLLSEYFSFVRPDAKQLEKEKVIADSAGFARNSQAALMFYEADDTVEKDYRRMYVIGWPGTATDYSETSGEDGTLTGGAHQTNPAHVLEVLSAMAAHHFFTDTKADEKHEVLYRSVDRSEQGALKIDFRDLAGDDYDDELRKKFGMFVALAHVTVAVQEGTYNNLQRLKENNVTQYDRIGPADVSDLDTYFRDFAYALKDDESIIPGWLWQVRSSVGSQFLFNPGLYATQKKNLKAFNFGELYQDEQHQFAKSGMVFKGKPEQEFFKALTSNAEAGGYSSPLDGYLARSYKTLTSLYRFNA